MKHATEELLLAAQVREIVRARIASRLPESCTLEQRAAAFSDVPKVQEVIAEVVAELEGIADVIAQARSV